MSNKNIRKRLSDEDIVFIIVSIVFALILTQISYISDDALSVHHINGTIVDYFETQVEAYYGWSSRFLVNFINFIFVDGRTTAWAIYMGISLFVMLKAMFLLFADRKKYVFESSLFITALVLSIDWIDIMSSAGWICTMTTYFVPVAYGFMALVPIKKIYKHEKISAWEYPVYIFSILYGGNIEQMMFVILVVYFFSFIFLKSKRYKSIFLYVLLACAVFNAVFTLTCPGNQTRSMSEINSWFPTWSMLDMLDKAEIAVSTTFRWILLDCNVFIIISCIALAVCIFRKYDNVLFRTISVIPVFVTVGLGVFNSSLASAYSGISSFTGQIPFYGLSTPDGSGELVVQWIFMCMTILCIALEIFLLQYTTKGLCITFVLILAGFASRCAMALSPTIYASAGRTYSVMCYCFIGAVFYTVSKCEVMLLPQKGDTAILNRKVAPVYVLLIIASLISLWASI